jgi:signal transduction histidine kinase
MRTPLNSIIGGTNISTRQLEEDQQRCLTMMPCGRRLLVLINDLIDLSIEPASLK